MLFFFFNSRCSEKETLETVSDENPGTREARGEACEWLQSESPLPGTLRGAASRAENSGVEKGSLSGDDITRQGWNAQSRAEGPRGQQGVWL